MNLSTQRIAQLLFNAVDLTATDLRRKAVALQRAIPLICQALVLKRGHKIEIRRKASGGMTDGSTIWIMDGVIPSSSTDIDAFARYVALKLGLMHHEVGHVNETDFSVSFNGLSPIVESAFRIIEDVRMENAHIRRYKASRNALDALSVAAIDIGMHSPATDDDHVTSLFQSYLLYGLRCHIRQQVEYAEHAEGARSRLASQIGDYVVDQIDGMFPDVATLLSTQDALDLAKDVGFLLEDEIRRQQENQSQSGQGNADPNAGDGDSNDVDQSDSNAQAVIDAIQQLLDCTDDQQSDDFDQQAREQIDGLAADMQGTAASIKPPDMDSIKAGLGELQNLTSLGGDTDLSQAESAIGRLSNRLRQRLQAQTIARSCRTDSGPRLYAKHVHRVALGDGRIFRKAPQSLGLKTDAAVFLLGDVSASMSNGNQGVRPIDVSNQALYAAAVSLQKVPGVDVSVGVFPGRQMVLRPGQRAMQHRSQFQLQANGECTPIDEGITMGIAALSNSKRSRKLLVVSTDGEPDDAESVIAAIDHARLVGIEVYAIGIQCDAAAALFEQCTVINDVNELPTALMGLLSGQLYQPLAAAS